VTEVLQSPTPQPRARRLRPRLVALAPLSSADDGRRGALRRPSATLAREVVTPRRRLVPREVPRDAFTAFVAYRRESNLR
jgi:hypothetical protein